jgi:hypothetical protein
MDVSIAATALRLPPRGRQGVEAALRRVGDAEQGEPVADASFDGPGVPTLGPFCYWSTPMKEAKPGN